MMHVIFTVTVGTASCHDPVGKGLVFGHRFPWLFRGVNLFYPRGVVVARNIYIHTVYTQTVQYILIHIYTLYVCILCICLKRYISWVHVCVTCTCYPHSEAERGASSGPTKPSWLPTFVVGWLGGLL